MSDRISPKTQPRISPPWSNTTKLIVGLTFVAALAGVLIRFRDFIVPLMLAFMLTYLLYPVTSKIRQWFKIPWRISATILYLSIILGIIGLMVWGGLALVEQIQSLYRLFQHAIIDLPDFFDRITSNPIQLGTFVWEPKLDWEDIAERIINAIQPVLSSMGSIVGSLATSTFSVLGWVFFVIMVSYFVLTETEGIPERIINFNLPGYHEDFKRLGAELNAIWNAFLRGQIVLMVVTLAIYSILLTVLGVRYSFFLAILAGLGRLVPYAGPAVAWTTYAGVTLLQGTTIFDLPSWGYAVLVVGIALLMDTVIDSIVTPRIMGDALNVHPAAVLLSALISVSVLGVVGVILAAPVLATVLLFFRYATHKMFDMDPWQGFKVTSTSKSGITVKAWFTKAWGILSGWVVRVFLILRSKLKK